MKVIFRNPDNHTVMKENGDVYFNDKFYGNYNGENAIVAGRNKRIRDITDDAPILYPADIIDNVIDYEYLVLATRTEAIKCYCNYKVKKEVKEVDGARFYVLKRSMFTYANIVGVNK